MKLHRIGLGLVMALGLVGAVSGLGCSPADTNDKIEITGTAPGSDVPQTQEEYMKKQMEMQKGAYQQAGEDAKKK